METHVQHQVKPPAPLMSRRQNIEAAERLTRELVGTQPRNAVDAMTRAAMDNAQPALARLGVDGVKSRFDLHGSDVQAMDEKLEADLEAVGAMHLYAQLSEALFSVGGVALLAVPVLVRDNRVDDTPGAWFDTQSYFLALAAGAVSIAVAEIGERQRRDHVVLREAEGIARTQRDIHLRRERDDLRAKVRGKLAQHLARIPVEARLWFDRASLFAAGTPERRLCLRLAETEGKADARGDEEIMRLQVAWADQLASREYPRGPSYADIARDMPLDEVK